MRPARFASVVPDPVVRAVLAEMYAQEAERRRSRDAVPGDWRRNASEDPFDYGDVGFSISPQQGDQIYTLARFGRARTIVEFATSLGFSTLYLAAAVRDNGGGLVHTAEIVPEKVEQARHNLERAGLDDFVELRLGDARETLRGAPAAIDLALIDGWDEHVSLEILKILEPRLRSGAVVLNDNHEDDYMTYVRDPANGYLSMPLPSGSTDKAATELSLRH